MKDYREKAQTYEDKTNRLIRQDVSVLGSKLSTSITYGNAQQGQVPDLVYGATGALNGSNVFGLSYAYDNLGRLTSRQVSGGITATYGYVNGAGNTTTTLVSSVNNGGDVLSYEYDAVGNITSVRRNGVLAESYTYDSLNQLKTVTRDGVTTTYTYDNGGNILSRTTGGTTINYTYGDAGWKDLLTKYNGQTITYDTIGNPLTYRDGMSFTWQNGRQLSTLTKGSNVVSYGYNGDGIRTSKTVNGVTTEYTLDDGGTIVAETKNGKTILYYFDDAGTRFGFRYDNADYFYVFNLQGDVIGILNSTGSRIVSYTYDAWGTPISVEDTSSNGIGTINPIRYRGYYYDAETGFYYLQTRYYDPVVGRFLSADTILGANTDAAGYNLFAYCGNNPVSRIDASGTSWWSVALAAVAVMAVCAVAVVAAPVVAPVVGVAASTMAVGYACTFVAATAVAVTTSIIAAVEEPLIPTAPPPSFGGRDTEKLIGDFGKILGGFGIGGCVFAAQYLKNELKNNGEHGEVITLIWPEAVNRAGRGIFIGVYVYSNSKKMVIGETGMHVGVKYKDKVYCNVHPYGLPEDEWINDFDCEGPRKIQRVKF